MGNAEFLIAGLLVAIVALSALARYLAVPYPIILVIGGAVLGFVPGLPEVELDPDVVLVIFLQLVLAAQREALLRMRSDGELSNEAMNRILRELDLEEARLEA
jgi:hypothetical protein